MATPTPWVYSDWITYPTGSSTRLTRLRLHIQEVSDALKKAGTVQYQISGRELDPKASDLRAELADLRKQEELEAERVDLADGDRLGWTSGRAPL